MTFPLIARISADWILHNPRPSAKSAEISGLEFRNAVAEFGEVELGAPDFRDGVAQISGREKS
jgi:hypothetical protein